MAQFYLADQLANRKNAGLWRSRHTRQSAQGASIIIANTRVANFASNDYLGLAAHPAIAQACQQSLATNGVGSGASHLICGHSSSHQALETALAEWTGRERALLFANGYMANLGVVCALLSGGDLLLQDRLNHASLLDAGLLSGARLRRYAHCDYADLQGKTDPTKQTIIASDGVFSMDGDLAPLPQIVQVAKDGAQVMVDDAHGFGVLGNTGGGIVEHYGLSQQQVPILMGTFGKSFGTYGAFVAGSADLIETLIQKSRTYIYTTALPPSLADATYASLQIVIKDSWRRAKLVELAGHFRRRASGMGLQLLASANGAIQPIILHDNLTATAAAKDLLAKGFLTAAIRPPTVPKGQARLRITLSAAHDIRQLDQLLDALGEILC